MKKYICVTMCTFGNPPRLYEPGNILLHEGACPKHFAETAEKKLVAQPAVQTLAEALPPSSRVEEVAGKSAPTESTVGQLAEELGVDLLVVKEATGKTRKTDALTGAEVVAATEAVKKLGKA